MPLHLFCEAGFLRSQISRQVAQNPCAAVMDATVRRPPTAKSGMKKRALLTTVLLAAITMALSPTSLRAQTALGDWGHYLRYAPKVYFLNSDGRAFTVTLHLFRWPVESWNTKQVTLRLTGPDGAAIVDGAVSVEGDSKTFDVPKGAKGAYLFEMNLPVKHPVGGPDFWVESSLDRSVVWTGDPNPTPAWAPAGQPLVHAIMGRWMLVQCSVPRRYWFWVPPETRTFTCRSQQIANYQSQREDWGITIFTPRGQRIRTLWGDADYKRNPPGSTMTVPVNVEPGAAGRFWCVELRFADSHNYSKISFSLEGVPPYLARSPEEWFDPTTGQVPVINPYDDDPFMQFARPKVADAWPWLQNFSPCPALGDADGAEVRGDATFALWNPDDRVLKFKVGSYLPRDMGSTAPQRAQVKITGANGKVIVERQDPLEHLHGEHGMPEDLPATGKGVAKVQIGGVERWFAFTYPATPLVLFGRDLGDGWSRFTLECGTARNWYFLVPRGTRELAVRAAAEHPTDVMALEVNAPDRTLAMIYDQKGERTVSVPPGLDGKVWHLRLDIGSATRMPNPADGPKRYLGLYLTLDLKGVPGLLAPTWEQWFDPAHPVSPERR